MFFRPPYILYGRNVMGESLVKTTNLQLVIKLIDKQIQNRISSMNHRESSAYQKSVATWFSFG
ncbi:unnamed protein product [Brassica napus]|uniref:(rape) hypothetical protein n=1 Tax=Brassica napus TaxID=3708 RepID=A0A816JSR1_BRANA|nr:unnamed protein product [Brassica napus]